MNKDFFTDNSTDNTNNSNDSGAKFHAKIRWQDVVQNEAELKAKKAEEQRLYNEAYKEFEKLILEMEEHAKDEQPKIEKTFFDKFFEMFGFLLNVGDAEGFERQAKNILFKQKKEQKRIFSIIQFLKSLLKKILSLESGLSWQERLAKEIADLEKKLDDGTISKEQLQRLELLKCIEFLGPVNLLSALVKIVSIAIALDLGFTISEKIAKTVENALSTTEEREIKAEMTDNLVFNLLDILKTPEIFKGLGSKLNEAFLKSIPAEFRFESRKGEKEVSGKAKFVPQRMEEPQTTLPKQAEEEKSEKQPATAAPQPQAAEGPGFQNEREFENKNSPFKKESDVKGRNQQDDADDGLKNFMRNKNNKPEFSSNERPGVKPDTNLSDTNEHQSFSQGEGIVR